EIGLLVKAAQESDRKQDLAFVLLMTHMGLRCGAVADLRIEDFGQEDGHWTVTFMGKGNKYAHLLVPQIVYRAVLQAADGRTEGPLILRVDGHRPIDKNVAYGWVKRLVRKAGIEKE